MFRLGSGIGTAMAHHSCLHHHLLNPDGRQPRVGEHPRGAMPIAGFSPQWLIPPQVGVDLLQPAVFDHPRDGHLRRRTGQPLGQRQGDVFRALGLGAEDDGLGFGQLPHGVSLLVVGSKEGGDVRYQVIVAVGIRADVHVTIVVAVQIGDLAEQGDGIVAGEQAFGLPRGGAGILFDLVALGAIKRHGRPP